MPTKKKRPPSLATRLLAFLAERPDEQFRCVEIAEHLNTETQRAATECGRLFRKGMVDRERVETRGRQQPLTYYRHLP